MRWAGNAACMGEMRNSGNILVGKPDRKRPLGRFTCRWEDNIIMILRETGWGGCELGCIWVRSGTSGRLLRTW
jgi:hypothetical protein